MTKISCAALCKGLRLIDLYLPINTEVHTHMGLIKDIYVLGYLLTHIILLSPIAIDAVELQWCQLLLEQTAFYGVND